MFTCGGRRNGRSVRIVFAGARSQESLVVVQLFSASTRNSLSVINGCMPPRRQTSLEEALSFVETEGIVLESAHGKVATFADFVAGERVTRWWSHPKG